ncbi:MAG: light-harvesting protein [Rhodospirillales bacterium]|jgi:light-harvesting complex 1 beta chain|nr:light-harvesting protein [Rhodospirillales bacterium]
MVSSGERATLSGLTPDEAKEFHGVFMSSFIAFIAVAIVAHILAWMWRPWLPGPEGYTSLVDSVKVAALQVLPNLV